MKRFILGIAVVLSGLMAAPSAHAQILGIGVQFIGSARGTLTATTSAGVVAIDNYNLVSGANGSAISLLDSNAAATGVTLSYSSAYTNVSYGGPATTGNQILQSGGLSQNAAGHSESVTLSNIPYASYSIYLYVGPNGTNGGSSTFDNSVTDGTTTYYSYVPGGSLGSYNQAVSTTAGIYTANANYILFTGETSSSLTLNLTLVNGAAVNINGFEIIDTAAVPEPGEVAYMLMGLFFVGAVGYFRRLRTRC